MNQTILEESYEKIFVDVRIYSPVTVSFLRGLAAAIQDAHPSWRPNISELAEILKSCDVKYRNCLLNAGASYGAAKLIGPGPAILLLGAAIQAIGEGSYPNRELEERIVAAESKLEAHGLKKDEDLKAVINAAKERASFDKVSELMRTEFRKGLESAGYPQERIDIVVPRIVKITHDVRHRGVINKTYTHVMEPNKRYMFKGPSGNSVGGGIFTDEQLLEADGASDAKIPTIMQESCEGISDPFAKVMLEGTFMMTSDYYDLLPYAQKGCAHRILNCINKIRIKLASVADLRIPDSLGSE